MDPNYPYSSDPRYADQRYPRPYEPSAPYPGSPYPGSPYPGSPYPGAQYSWYAAPTQPMAPWPPVPPPRRRPNLAARLTVSLTATLLTLCVALSCVGLVADPQVMTGLLPFAAIRVSGTIYGERVAQRGAGSPAPAPLAGAQITCGGIRAVSDGHGHYALTLERARAYSCGIRATSYTAADVRLAPHVASAFHLDLGPLTSKASALCSISSTRETCPALALVAGTLSGSVVEHGGGGPVANAMTLCWDDTARAQINSQLPLRYSTTTDAKGRFTFRGLPPGPYLCVANSQGAPQPVEVAPGTPTMTNFSVCGSSCGGLSYHQGPVLHTFTAYVIFWQPNGRSLEPSGDNSRFTSLVRQYLTDVGGTRFYGLLTQYWDQQGPVRNVSTLGGVAVDTRPYPHAGTRSDPLSDTDITQEINQVRAKQGWGAQDGVAYVMITAYNTQECAKFENETTCSFPSNGNNGFCAYHSFMQASGSPTGYLPYIVSANNYDCSYLPSFDSAGIPYGDPNADTVINSLSHEQFEVVTDPFTRGWYDNNPSGGEIGDKCETTFGSPDWDGSTVTLNKGHGYVLQAEYSNLAGGCAYS